MNAKATNTKRTEQSFELETDSCGLRSDARALRALRPHGPRERGRKKKMAVDQRSVAATIEKLQAMSMSRCVQV
jgi:hypothetical protein